MVGAKLSLVVFSGGFDRVHYALAMAAAAAATGRPVSLLITGRALAALVDSGDPARPGWTDLDTADDGAAPAARNQTLVGRGVAGFEELLTAAAALGVTVIVCEMGLRALGPAGGRRLRADIPHRVGGIVSFLGAAEGGSILFV
ncbi:MAG: hypothetical protein WCO00_02180 [Rhodospirillaceae bacterium]